MTTSDNDGPFDDPNDSADQPVDLVNEDSDEAYGDGYGDASGEGLAPAVPPARWPLAILAALGAAALGIALWSVIFVAAEREYVGVSVVIGLTVGWLVRVVSRRSNLVARVVAVVITAIACVLGTVVAEVAYTSSQFEFGFLKLLGDVLPNTFELLSDRPGMTLVIFAAALVLAFLSAGPQKEKPSKRRGQPEPVDVVDDGEPPAAALADE